MKQQQRCYRGTPYTSQTSADNPGFREDPVPSTTTSRQEPAKPRTVETAEEAKARRSREGGIK